MPSDDRIYETLSPLNSATSYFAMEFESQLQESDGVEVQDDRNGPNHSKKKLSPRRRKRQPCHELTEAKGKSTKKCRPTAPTFDVGEASEPKRKEDRVTELIKKKSVSEVLKILRDRVNRRIKNNRISELISPIVVSLGKIRRQWPARLDLDNIKERIKQMEKEEREKGNQGMMEVTDDEKRRLEEIEQKIKSSDEERRKDSVKADKLEEIFTTEGVSMDILREKLSLAFPWLFLEEIATNEPAAIQVQASSQTFPVKNIEELEEKVFDNKKPPVSAHFPGLEDAVTAANPNIPDKLNSIANRIKGARNETTDDLYLRILIRVSAAVKEMEDTAVDKLDCSILCKWGAAFNLAKGAGFDVKFVEDLLKKNMHAFFSYSRLKAVDTPKKKGSEITG